MPPDPRYPLHSGARLTALQLFRRPAGIAATALMVGLTVAAQAGVNHAHTHHPLAGITLNAID